MKRNLIKLLIMISVTTSVTASVEMSKAFAIEQKQEVIQETVSMGKENVSKEITDIPEETAKSTNEVVNTDSLKNSVNNIYAGKGKVEDYLNLGLSNVTAQNLLWVNAETHERINLSLSAEKVNERKDSIVKAVNAAIKEYPLIKIINDGKETCDSTNIIEYRKLTGAVINKSNLALIRIAITIEKDVKGRELTKQEIIKVYTEVLNNPDSKYIMLPIRQAINTAKDKNPNLTTTQVQSVINDTNARINSSYAKIVKGEATVADYQLLQIKGVNAANIVWVNAEVRENVDIKLKLETANGKINNVQSAITKLMDIYKIAKPINDGRETCDSTNVIEYRKLSGIVMNKSKLSKARQAIAAARVQKGRDLTKQEIIQILKTI